MAKKATRKRASAKKAAAEPAVADRTVADPGPEPVPAKKTTRRRSAAAALTPIFQAPEPVGESAPPPGAATSVVSKAEATTSENPADASPASPAEASSAEAPTRRRRSRGGRNRRKSTDTSSADATAAAGVTVVAVADAGTTERAPVQAPTEDRSSASETDGEAESATPSDDSTSSATSTSTSSSSRRRRRRRRTSDSSSETSSDVAADTPPATTKKAAKAREPRPASESITNVEGSTRIEAKKQRRREGRDAGRRRAPILSESEFLARRESVERVMVIRQRHDITQIAVLEDNVLVEHYVALETQNSLLGNVYLGRVQNVLPSMEAAFVDIGKGRNAVLYAGEVNWDLIGDRNQPRRIENALKPGQQILVQVSKDPVGHKGARLTSQISLPGRYLVYVPDGGSSGISRKLPDTERSRLKSLLKDILPDESGVIIRTAAEGASEEELTRDVTRLTARWEEISKLIKTGKAPALLYAEPDVTLKVVRDLFTEDFARLVISGDEAWDLVNDYVSYVAPDLTDRLERYDAEADVFATYRVDEQIAKALERKVWLPSGGSLVIDRTEAMTVVDVNTGKFTGSGGNLEQTVTKNNLEAAEETVRQLRLRDIGGIIVIDFIDMVLESNRDLVLRRLVECLGRDRTRHQVAEVTSLGLVQMTRKRIGTGLVEAFSVPCEVCHGRGVVIESEPVNARSEEPPEQSRTTASKRSSGRRRAGTKDTAVTDAVSAEQHSAAAAATAAIAAALHPETKTPDTDSADFSDSSDSSDAGDSSVAESGERPAVDEEPPTTSTSAKRAPATKKASSKKATARKATTSKKTSTTTKKASATKQVSATRKASPTKKASPVSA